MMLFKTLVIPILEYGSVIWSPYKKCEISKIEAVQRTFTSKLDGMEDLDYHQRLQKLQIYSLERRRARYDALYSIKVLKKLVPNIGLQFKWSDRRGRRLVPPPVAKNSSAHSKLYETTVTDQEHHVTLTPYQLRSEMLQWKPTCLESKPC